MTIIDWNDKVSMKDAGDIVKVVSNPLLDYPEVQLFAKTGQLEGLLFRNFPKIRAKEKFIKNCAFENCGYLSFESCEVRMCVFFSIDTMSFDDSIVIGGNFQQLCSCYGELILLKNSIMTGGIFTNITLANKSYLCMGEGDSKVELCTFNKIRTDREDKAIFHYRASKDTSSENQSGYSFVDEESCCGKEEIALAKQYCPERDREISRLLCTGPYILPNFPKRAKSPCIRKRK